MKSPRNSRNLVVLCGQRDHRGRCKVKSENFPPVYSHVRCKICIFTHIDSKSWISDSCRLLSVRSDVMLSICSLTRDTFIKIYCDTVGTTGKAKLSSSFHVTAFPRYNVVHPSLPRSFADFSLTQHNTPPEANASQKLSFHKKIY